MLKYLKKRRKETDIVKIGRKSVIILFVLEQDVFRI